MQNLRVLTMQTTHEALHIADNDMIFITWKHATIRINVTGLIYLVDFLNGDERRRAIGFDVLGTPDDGYQIWIADAGLRLTPDECQRFKQLLEDGLSSLREMGKDASPNDLPDCLKLTDDAHVSGVFHQN